MIHGTFFTSKQQSTCKGWRGYDADVAFSPAMTVLRGIPPTLVQSMLSARAKMGLRLPLIPTSPPLPEQGEKMGALNRNSQNYTNKNNYQRKTQKERYFK